jgi:hypothetical protein
MSNWQKYESHKVVIAGVITEITSDERLFVGDELFEPTEPSMAKRASVGWYAVIYKDGFKSVSPWATFEEGYILV